ncbi:MAG TPA: helix-turn-helix domain-containing protein [Galbitalea sp.]|jgi:transcriptional regulator with XRE-family HTH domain|nr:helix-turn-helix domain-containing protein [Galbitalea sp.]
MADFKTATTVGARIAAIRKARGYASAKALAEAIPGDSVTESILQNIEAGRKNDLAVAQLLNIAWALRVPPVFILAPLGNPNGSLDLPNIIPDIQELTVGEFDGWLSGLDDGPYRPITADERNERIQLNALRELLAARREAHRLQTIVDHATELAPDKTEDEAVALWSNFQQRLDDTNRNIQQLEAYLRSAGWVVDSHE